MSKPIASDVRAMLEGYGITLDVITDTWIDARIINTVIPFVENTTRQKFSGIASVTEYHDGSGESILILDRRPILAVTAIKYVTGGDYQVILNLAMIETIAAEGILKAKVNLLESSACFPYFVKGNRNIMVTYTYGYTDYPDDIKESIVYFTCEAALGFLGARTGGGNISGQSFSRSFGDRGKYTDIRNDCARQGKALLYPYITHVTGS
jgi:hypothetical protein